MKGDPTGPVNADAHFHHRWSTYIAQLPPYGDTVLGFTAARRDVTIKLAQLQFALSVKSGRCSGNIQCDWTHCQSVPVDLSSTEMPTPSGRCSSSYDQGQHGRLIPNR